MLRYILPIILIGVGITGFFLYTNPIFSDISKIKNDIASYNEALDNAKSLENERDKLTKKYNAINLDDLSKLQKLLPDNVDNIRLILEIEKLALPYGMILKDVKYDSVITDKKNGASQEKDSEISSRPEKAESKGYGEWTLSFSTEGTYPKFISFIKDLESNLRIVDISSISFSSDTGGGAVLGKVKPLDSYNYSFSIKTYWLKN